MTEANQRTPSNRNMVRAWRLFCRNRLQFLTAAVDESARDELLAAIAAELEAAERRGQKQNAAPA